MSEQEAILTEQIYLQQSLLEEKLDDSLELSNSLASRLTRLESLITNQQALIEIKENAHVRMQGLVEKRFIARDQLDRLSAELLQEKNTLDNYHLQKSELREEEKRLQQYRDVYRNEYQERILTLEAEKAALHQEVVNTSYQSNNSVLAPINGTVRVIASTVGEYVTPGQRVILLIPPDAVFEAELFVPSNAIGFLERGQEANIRLAAFPYQKFGVQTGHIAEISNTVLMPNEIPGNINIAEPVYRVRVQLDNQSVQAFGREIPLRSGMLLQATLIQEQRSLMEWLLEPLYSVLG